MKKNLSSPGSRGLLRKLAFYAVIGLFSLYGLYVVAGYSWLRFVRKNEQVKLLDVAFVRLGEIRRANAMQHFANGRQEWEAKNYQAAYLSFATGVRQDPENLAGRLEAVRFLRSVGAGGLALAMLEEGLVRAPTERQLIEPTFDFLLSTGRQRHALELLRKNYPTGLSGPNEPLLQRYEVEATLAVEGAVTAKQLLDRRPGLMKNALATPVVARVLWESQERLRAIGLLQAYVQTQPSAGYPDYALLAGWQETGGLAGEAVQTARSACTHFPRELAARVLLIEMIAAETPAGPAVPEAVTAYLREFADRPESLISLANLAGRKGWVELARNLYAIGANRQLDLNQMALSYSDALARGSRFKEVQRILAGLESQASDASVPFLVQLRQRQVIAAAALGDTDNVREYARRLAAVLNRDPEGLEVCRGLFRKMGIADALAELSSRSLTASTAGRK